jgi:hypothetical protein
MSPSSNRSSTSADLNFPSQASRISLELIFNHYCLLQPPRQQRMQAKISFSEIATANATLSTLETLALCRDFDIVPNLITKAELAKVCKVCKVKRGHNQPIDNIDGDDERNLNELNFDDLLDFLVHVALLAFNKPAFRRTTNNISSNAASSNIPRKSLESPEECCKRLALFLRLSEPRHARHVVLTRGKESATKFSAGERQEDRDYSVDFGNQGPASFALQN